MAPINVKSIKVNFIGSIPSFCRSLDVEIAAYARYTAPFCWVVHSGLASEGRARLNPNMEEIEVPTEHLQEQIKEEIEKEESDRENGHGGGHPGWIMYAALLSALIAVFAAVSSLRAGQDVNEAMMAQIESSDHWSHYQAKSIKASVMSGRKEAFQLAGKTPPAELDGKLEKYEKDLEEASTEAKAKTEQSKHFIERHEIFATAVTLFQIAIAMIAICVLVRRKKMLAVSFFFMLCGLIYFVRGFLYIVT
jgi:hypothetical protein